MKIQAKENAKAKMNVGSVRGEMEFTLLQKDSLYVDGNKPTPIDLVKEINDKIDYNKDDKVLVLFDYMFAIDVAMRLKVKNVYLTMSSFNPKTYRWLKLLNITPIEMEQAKDMKFDVVVGNPPFSKANEGSTAGKKAVNLYPTFFEMALGIADRIAMIMPRTDNQLQLEHNTNIVNNAYAVEEVDERHFAIPTKPWVVYVDKNNPTRIKNYLDSSINNDTKWMKGKMPSGKHLWEDSAGQYDVINAIHKTGPQLFKTNQYRKSATLPTTGYSVTFGITANAVFVIPCTGQLIGVNVYSVWFNSLDAANDFSDKLQTMFKDGSIDHLRGNNGVMTMATLKQIKC